MICDPLFLERLDEIINFFCANFLAFFRIGVDESRRSHFRQLVLRSCGVLQSEKKERGTISLPDGMSLKRWGREDDITELDEGNKKMCIPDATPAAFVQAASLSPLKLWPRQKPAASPLAAYRHGLGKRAFSLQGLFRI